MARTQPATTRRLTPLGQRLVERIRLDGPIGVDQFMMAALGDSEHGYYMTRDPFGRAGDFTTSPEISQVFGEIIGAWLAESWRQMGGPAETLLIELGPGRGTLAADVLRALRVLPACRAAVRLHLVETSPLLRQRQRETLRDIPIVWHDSIDQVPAGPFLLVANELFDALPVSQHVRRGESWFERRVGLDEAGALAFVEHAAPNVESLRRRAPAAGEGILETSEPRTRLAAAIGGRLAASPGTALLIDYGYRETSFGDTLQAVRGHVPVDPLAAPGEADLTAHVDFQAIADSIAAASASVWGPITQRAFLIGSGALLRAAMLERKADAATAATIRQGVDRLLDPAGMGTLFQVVAATSPGLPRPVAF